MFAHCMQVVTESQTSAKPSRERGYQGPALTMFAHCMQAGWKNSRKIVKLKFTNSFGLNSKCWYTSIYSDILFGGIIIVFDF